MHETHRIISMLLVATIFISSVFTAYAISPSAEGYFELERNTLFNYERPAPVPTPSPLLELAPTYQDEFVFSQFYISSHWEVETSSSTPPSLYIFGIPMNEVVWMLQRQEATQLRDEMIFFIEEKFNIERTPTPLDLKIEPNPPIYLGTHNAVRMGSNHMDSNHMDIDYIFAMAVLDKLHRPSSVRPIDIFSYDIQYKTLKAFVEIFNGVGIYDIYDFLNMVGEHKLHESDSFFEPLAIPRRTRVYNTRRGPYYGVVQIIIYCPSFRNGYTVASGFMVSRTTLVTSAHNVYDRMHFVHNRHNRMNPQRIRVIPGRNGSYFPFGTSPPTPFAAQYVANGSNVWMGYTFGRDFRTQDYAFIRLAHTVNIPSFMHLLSIPNDQHLMNLDISLVGYPRDGGLGGTVMISSPGRVDTVGHERGEFTVTAVSTPGISGGPVFNSTRWVVGMARGPHHRHPYLGQPVPTSAVRFGQYIIDWARHNGLL